MYMKGAITEMKTTPVKFQRLYTHGGQQKCKTEIRSSPSLYVIFFLCLLTIAVAYCFLYRLLEMFENQGKNDASQNKNSTKYEGGELG